MNSKFDKGILTGQIMDSKTDYLIEKIRSGIGKCKNGRNQIPRYLEK